MKKFGIFLLVLLLLCTGCASKTTAPLLQSSDAARVDHAVMVPQWGGKPQETYAAKACVNTADVRAIVQTLQKAELEEEIDTIYGGLNVLFRLYQEDTLVAELYIIDGDKVAMNGKFYNCSNLPNLEELYNNLQTAETQIIL